MQTHSDDGAERERRFRSLYAATYPDLLRFVSRRVHPSHAEDVVADTFLVAWRRLDAIPAETGDARAWLFGTTRKVLLNDRRGLRRREALAVRIGDAAATAVTDLEPEQLADRLDLAAAWRRLTDTEQETFALAVWDDLTGPQAASVLGISPVAYRLRLTRARRSLRRHLDQPTPAGMTDPTSLVEGHPR